MPDDHFVDLDPVFLDKRTKLSKGSDSVVYSLDANPDVVAKTAPKDFEATQEFIAYERIQYKRAKIAERSGLNVEQIKDLLKSPSKEILLDPKRSELLGIYSINVPYFYNEETYDVEMGGKVDRYKHAVAYTKRFDGDLYHYQSQNPMNEDTHFSQSEVESILTSAACMLDELHKIGVASEDLKSKNFLYKKVGDQLVTAYGDMSAVEVRDTLERPDDGKYHPEYWRQRRDQLNIQNYKTEAEFDSYVQKAMFRPTAHFDKHAFAVFIADILIINHYDDIQFRKKKLWETLREAYGEEIYTEVVHFSQEAGLEPDTMRKFAYKILQALDRHASLRHS